MNTAVRKAIQFPFAIPEGTTRTIEKDDAASGRKRRYICGVASGIKRDNHGERMTEKCIKSFMDQANSGDILLFPDMHGIRESTDIGRLTSCKLLDNEDWYIENMLYDELDGVGSVKLETIDTLWKQINGLPPYTRPRQKGFSIEGIIPQPNGAASSTTVVRNGTLDEILLDGVVLVPRPAYPSVATAVFKALGITTPERINSIQESLRNKLNKEGLKDKYYKSKWQYQDALEELIENIMTRKNSNKQEELKILFDEYQELLISLIISSEDAFEPKDLTVDTDTLLSVSNSQVVGKDLLASKLESYKELRKSILDYTKIVGAKNENQS